VHWRSRRLRAVAALLMAGALSGCSNVDWDSSQLFRKQFDLFGHSTGGYSYSDLEEARLDRPIGPNDLIEANGTCPPPAASQPQPSNQAASPAAAPEVPSALGEGVGLGMSECEVVYRAGQPSNIQLGQNPNGDRTAVLTFDGGPRPGIYRFERGRLVEMDRVAEPAPPPAVVKKKPAKKPKKNDQA
jgi:hypothetical protein